MRVVEPASPPPLDACPALVLNADYRPLSYFPLSTWHWQETIKAMFLDRVSVLCHYDRVVRSPASEHKLPSVVALKECVPQNRRPPFTRFNVFLRDHFTCQYCAVPFGAHELTFDHVIPRSRG
ncbi:MAG: HNH endonuclease, partial [Geminicoccaceae bacterium]